VLNTVLPKMTGQPSEQGPRDPYQKAVFFASELGGATLERRYRQGIGGAGLRHQAKLVQSADRD
jgi:hypothetical protein